MLLWVPPIPAMGEKESPYEQSTARVGKVAVSRRFVANFLFIANLG